MFVRYEKSSSMSIFVEVSSVADTFFTVSACPIVCTMKRVQPALIADSSKVSRRLSEGIIAGRYAQSSTEMSDFFHFVSAIRSYDAS
mgnify:CR=1 FL=1